MPLDADSTSGEFWSFQRQDRRVTQTCESGGPAWQRTSGIPEPRLAGGDACAGVWQRASGAGPVDLMFLSTPTVQLMALLKVADNSLDYSLGNTTKQALWLPASREAKYKAKQALDCPSCASCDSCRPASVGRRADADHRAAFAAITLVFVCRWLTVAAGIICTGRTASGAPCAVSQRTRSIGTTRAN